jgi:hypothetical protein
MANKNRTNLRRSGRTKPSDSPAQKPANGRKRKTESNADPSKRQRKAQENRIRSAETITNSDEDLDGDKNTNKTSSTNNQVAALRDDSNKDDQPPTRTAVSDTEHKEPHTTTTIPPNPTRDHPTSEPHTTTTIPPNPTGDHPTYQMSDSIFDPRPTDGLDPLQTRVEMINLPDWLLDELDQKMTDWVEPRLIEDETDADWKAALKMQDDLHKHLKGDAVAAIRGVNNLTPMKCRENIGQLMSYLGFSDPVACQTYLIKFGKSLSLRTV